MSPLLVALATVHVQSSFVRRPFAASSLETVRSFSARRCHHCRPVRSWSILLGRRKFSSSSSCFAAAWWSEALGSQDRSLRHKGETLNRRHWNTTAESSVSLQLQQQTQQQTQPVKQRHDDVLLSPRLLLRIVDTTDSTQDEARRMLTEMFATISNRCIGPVARSNTIATTTSSPACAVAVLAHRQTAGRGTRGRTWECPGHGGGNLLLTVALPLDCLPVRITLLPLQVAVLVAQHVRNRILASANDDHQQLPKIVVKWPNDVLVNDQKISGTLIENFVVPGSTTVWLLIGTGVNLNSKPDLRATTTPDFHGRRLATCLNDHLGHGNLRSSGGLTPCEFGVSFANALVEWALPDSDDSNDGGTLSAWTGSSSTLSSAGAQRAEQERQVLEQWRQFAELGRKYEIRESVDGTEHGVPSGRSCQGELVQTIDVLDDGQLLVRDAQGNERLLVVDYLV